MRSAILAEGPGGRAAKRVRAPGVSEPPRDSPLSTQVLRRREPARIGGVRDSPRAVRNVAAARSLGAHFLNEFDNRLAHVGKPGL